MKKKGNYGKLNKNEQTQPLPYRRKRQTKPGVKSRKGKLFRYEGEFLATDKGYGFVRVEGCASDVFIPDRYTAYAFHGDRVEIELLDPGPLDMSGSVSSKQTYGPAGREKRREARVVKIVSHTITRIVGIFEEIRNGYGFVIPDNVKLSSDIFIPAGSTAGAKTGDKVVAVISDYGEFKRSPEGEIIQVIGDTEDPRTDSVGIVCALDIRKDFPEEVLKYCDDICGDGTVEGSGIYDAREEITEISSMSEIFEPDFEKKGRLDLRNIRTFTIDGDDSGDYDDAVSLEKFGDDLILGVHIADVSEYVREGSPLDAEALERGCSVYFPGEVIPMLPEKLSCGLCSLNPDEDRLSLSCIMRVDEKGRVTDHLITESMIRSSLRMTYSGVDRVLSENYEKYCNGDKLLSSDEKYRGFEEILCDMISLSEVLNARRMRKGSIDFDARECEISVDENGKVIDVRARDRSASRSLIEEFMLLANKTVAREFCKKKIPFAYRIHEEPDRLKIRALADCFKKLGLSVDRSLEKKLANDELPIASSDIVSLLDESEGTPFEILIRTLTLRSMQRAVYDPECSGHFGLNFKYYCHFTSPIRRYPDLQVHRIIKQYLRRELDKAAKEHYTEILPEVCRRSSVSERKAQEAEYQVDRLKQIRFMADRMGDEFEGVISGVTSYGVFVKLDNTIEGMISVYDLPTDDYRYDEAFLRLTGSRRKNVYSVGKRIKVSVCACDINRRTIDLIPV